MNRKTICQDNQNVGNFCTFAEGVIGISDEDIKELIKESFKVLANDLDLWYSNINHVTLDNFDISDLENIIEDVIDQFGDADSYNVSSRITSLGTTILAVEWTK